MVDIIYIDYIRAFDKITCGWRFWKVKLHEIQGEYIIGLLVRSRV